MVSETVKAGVGGPGEKTPEWREMRRLDTGQGLLGGGTVLMGWGRHDKHHRQGSVNNRNLFPHSPGGYKSKIKLAGWLLRRTLSLACS